MNSSKWTVMFLALLALLGAGAALLFLSGPFGVAGPGPSSEEEADRTPPVLEQAYISGEAVAPEGRRAVPILGASRSGDPEWQAALGGILGRILEHDGAPAAGLEVEAAGDWLPVLMEGLRSLLALEEDRFQPSFVSTRTDAEGRFRLDGFYPRETALLRIAENGETLLSHPLPGAPGRGELLDLGEIRLPRFAQVSGRVEDQETGEPVAGARVWVSCLPGVVPATGLLDLHGGEWLLGDFGDRNAGVAVFRLPQAFAQVRRHMALPGGSTDPEGRFCLRRVNPGRASLMVEKDGYQTARRLSFPVPAGRTRDMGTVSITRENVIRVQVKDAAGKPVAGVEVLAGVMPALLPVAVMRPLGSTGEAGDVTASGFPDGRVYLAGRGVGQAWSVAGPFAQGEELVLSLRGGCDLTFVCVAGEEARPLTPDRVLLTTLLDHTSLTGYASVEEGGQIRLKNLPEGMFLLRVSAEGFLDALEVIRAGGPAEAEPGRIVLEPEHFLEVVVHDIQGRPLSGVRLLPIAEDLVIRSGEHLRAPHIQAFFTDPLGQVRVGPLAQGTHKLGVWHPKHGECLVAAQVPGKGTLLVTLASGRIEGWVEPSGPPAAGGRWLAYLAGESVRPFTSTPVSPEGLFTFEGVAPGRWNLFVLEEKPSQPLEALIFSVATGAHSPAGLENGIQVQAGQTTRLVVRLAGAGGDVGVVEGLVRCAGRPAEGILVVAAAGMRKLTGSTGPDGTYRLEGVPAGKLFLTVGLFDRGFEGEVRKVDSALVEVAPGARTRQDFDLPVGSIEGRAEDGQGRPVAGLHVRAHALKVEGSRQGIDAITDQEGGFAMSYVAPGLWELRVQGETVAARSPTPVTLLPGHERAFVELVALRRVLAHLILDPAPTPGAKRRNLRWRPVGVTQEGDSEMTQVGTDGQVRLNTLPGRYELDYLEQDAQGRTWLRRGQVVIPESASGPIRAVMGLPLSSLDAFPKLPFAGTFTDAKGQGLGPGKVWINPSDRFIHATDHKFPAISLDAQGRFSTEAPAGKYWFHLRVEGEGDEKKAADFNGTFVIPAGGRLDATIQVR